MRIRRKLIRNSKFSRTLVLPAIWLESFREAGIDVREVYLTLKEDNSIIVEPIIIKK